MLSTYAISNQMDVILFEFSFTFRAVDAMEIFRNRSFNKMVFFPLTHFFDKKTKLPGSIVNDVSKRKTKTKTKKKILPDRYGT